MMLFAIDPGSTESALIRYDPDRAMLSSFAKLPNEEVRRAVSNVGYRSAGAGDNPSAHLAIEMIASYGMPVGAEVFQTCVWIGRFVEAWAGREDMHTLIYRKDVKLNLCGQPRAKDSNIRQALIDRWGGKSTAIGTSKNRGPLFGVSADIWSALAVAVTWSDARKAVAA